MVSDWQHVNEYSYLIKLLEQKYNKNIEYYPVDDKLYIKAKKHNNQHGGGGCSYYIFSWVKTREEYKNYQI